MREERERERDKKKERERERKREREKEREWHSRRREKRHDGGDVITVIGVYWQYYSCAIEWPNVCNALRCHAVIVNWYVSR